MSPRLILQPVILSGGSGTRLWPLSREHYPKQLLSLTGENSLLQETLARLDGIDDRLTGNTIELGAPIIVCNEEHRFLVAEQVRQFGVHSDRIILEPAGRNTAPALTLAALAVHHPAAETILLVMPADHVIDDKSAFQQAVIAAIDLAAEGRMITFGIVPTKAATGYGYIHKGSQVKGHHHAYVLQEFVEKPEAARAEEYVQSGDYYWNSGIFMMQARVWLEEIQRHQPGIAEKCTEAYRAGVQDRDFFRVDREAFLACPSDSIDYAVMEKVTGGDGAGQSFRAAVLPLDAGWSDVGAWASLWEVSPHDADGNLTKGDVFCLNTHNSLLLAENRFLAAVGLEDMIVVETADAVMVAHKDETQKVKDIAVHLKAASRSEYLDHRRVYRPWGSYEGVDAGERFQVKRIIVNPGAALSLQMHHHRAEHWIVVKGTAKVTRGDETFLLSENESTYIPIGTHHRLENPGTLPLELIEVQSGSYLGEDDIIRFDDEYGRAEEQAN